MLIQTVLPLMLTCANATGEIEALRGLDPIELGQGREVAGSAELTAAYGAYAYRFASTDNRALFESDPERYGIQWGGGCGRMGPLSGRGDVARFAVHDGRVWIFASDGCRDGFLKAPERFLWRDDPPPEATDEARRQGAELLRRVIDAVGGEDALAGLRTYRERTVRRREYEGEDVRTDQVLIVGADGYAREESSWGESRWANVLTPTAAFACATGKVDVALVASQRRELERQLHQQLVSLLLARHRPDLLVASAERGTADAADIDLCIVHFAGQTTTLGIAHDSGQPRFLRYQGRVGTGSVGAVEVQLSDWRAAGDLLLPFRRITSVNGKAVGEEGEIVDNTIEINATIDPALFGG